MAKCNRCGKSLGLFASSRLCDECAEFVEAEREELRAEEYEKEKKAMAEATVSLTQSIRERLESGGSIVLFESIYLPVDSRIVDDLVTDHFSIRELRRMGLDGWDVVAVVPRTQGIALTNSSIGTTSGETWGAGLGGNVVGVHLIIKKEVSTQNNVSEKFLEEYVMRNITDFLND